LVFVTESDVDFGNKRGVFLRRVHVDKNVISSAGISSSIDLDIRLLELIYDRTTSLKVAERPELRPPITNERTGLTHRRRSASVSL
jgi:transcriptional regulator GlxA family with amidase domain